MANSNQLSEAEGDFIRVVLAFIQLPNSRLKLTKPEKEIVKDLQERLNEDSW